MYPATMTRTAILKLKYAIANDQCSAWAKKASIKENALSAGMAYLDWVTRWRIVQDQLRFQQ